MALVIKEISFDQESIRFITESLQQGCVISASVLLNLDQQRFKISAILEEDSQYTNFEYGGVMKVEGARTHLTKIILDYLIQSETNAFIAEDTIGSPRSAYIQRSGLPYFSISDNVYYFASGNMARTENILKILRQSGGYPFIAYLFKSDDDEVIKMHANKMSLVDCERIARSWDKLFMSVFDDETYLIIERLG
jgi:hypothetical protein